MKYPCLIMFFFEKVPALFWSFVFDSAKFYPDTFYLYWISSKVFTRLTEVLSSGKKKGPYSLTPFSNISKSKSRKHWYIIDNHNFLRNKIKNEPASLVFRSQKSHFGPNIFVPMLLLAASCLFGSQKIFLVSYRRYSLDIIYKFYKTDILLILSSLKSNASLTKLN